MEQSTDEKSSLDEKQSYVTGSVIPVPVGDSHEAMPPPSYDEIYGDQKEQSHQQQQPDEQQRQQNLFQTSSVTGTTTDEPAVCPSSLPCVAKFGRYTDPSTGPPQPGQLTSPSRISVRVDLADEPGSPTVMLVDRSTSSVQVFASNGDSLSALRVPQVNGGCFIGHQPTLLLLAVGTSVSVHETDGRLVKQIPLRGRHQDLSLIHI